MCGIAGAEPIISSFGIDGDGLDRAVRSSYHRNLLIHCGTHRSNVEIDWFSPNGDMVGTSRNLREAHYNNGTTVLQIAAFRRLNSCDGGVYTCVANDTSSRKVQHKNFTLIIGSKFKLLKWSREYCYFLNRCTRRTQSTLPRTDHKQFHSNNLGGTSVYRRTYNY